jgi:hypothetical protein
MQQILGEYVERDSGRESLLIRFSTHAIPRPLRWQNNGLLADFLAEYWATLLDAYAVPPERRDEIKGTIAYVANELLENLVKFNYQPERRPVNLELSLHADALRFYASNAIDPQAIEPFQAWIRRLLYKDPADLYREKMKRMGADKTDGRSRLGLLSLLNDYGARLAWKFERDAHDPQLVLVTTMVQVDI